MVSTVNRPKLRILGTRGIPAQHGGFETFAEHLATYLAGRGWDVVVYCQESGPGETWESEWRGVRLVHIPVARSGAWSTIDFDWQSVRHAAREPGLVLTLGYNTAAFCVRYRMKGIPNLINMDGIEWKRRKWSRLERAWLYINERAGCWAGNHLIADHPQIKAYLTTRAPSDRITMIPYGADLVLNPDLPPFDLEPGSYALIVARPEPENSILEMVRAFSRRKRAKRLVVLGAYHADNVYHRQVLDSASEEVLFPGALYDAKQVANLRFHACLYLHGHTVGGTNPSLVEALAAGSPVLAHDNTFNRWVAGSEAHYFDDEDDCAKELDLLLDDVTLLGKMRDASLNHHQAHFTWNKILADYETLLSKWT